MNNAVLNVMGIVGALCLVTLVLHSRLAKSQNVVTKSLLGIGGSGLLLLGGLVNFYHPVVIYAYFSWVLFMLLDLVMATVQKFKNKTEK